MMTLRPVGYRRSMLLVLLLYIGCTSDEKRPAPPPPHRDTVAIHASDTGFHVPDFPVGRRLDTVITIVLDPKQPPLYLVTSIREDSAGVLSGRGYVAGRADLWQLYSYDPHIRRYSVTFLDSGEWATEFTVDDLTGDGQPELIIPIRAGGNDIVATFGLAIYSFDDGIHTIYRTDSGDPSITRTMHGTTIELHDELWPSFASHADAQEYLDDILAYRDGRFVSVRKEQRSLFVAYATGYLKDYGELRPKYLADTVETGTPEDSDIPHRLFVPAAMGIISFGRGGDIRSMRSFWSSERNYLEKRLPHNQYLELATIYAKMIDT